MKKKEGNKQKEKREENEYKEKRKQELRTMDRKRAQKRVGFRVFYVILTLQGY